MEIACKECVCTRIYSWIWDECPIFQLDLDVHAPFMGCLRSCWKESFRSRHSTRNACPQHASRWLLEPRKPCSSHSDYELDWCLLRCALTPRFPLVLPNLPIPRADSKTQREHGRKAQLSNISAARAVADIIRTTLGPRAMLKMILDPVGGINLTNDGNAILREVRRFLSADFLPLSASFEPPASYPSLTISSSLRFLSLLRPRPPPVGRCLSPGRQEHD